MRVPPTDGDSVATPGPGARPRRDPPRWLDAAVLAAAALLLFFPLHVPYQNPDQDLPVTLSILDFVRGGWSPISLHFPTALTNLLRAAYAVGLEAARLAGLAADPIDVLVAWRLEHRLFRILPRVIAMASGVAALVAVRGLARRLGGGWIGLVAVALLGTSFGFVRECHHGMFDAPPAAAVAGLLWAAAVHVETGSRRSIALAGLLLGVALAFKQNSAIGGIAIVVALAASPAPWRARLGGAAIATACGVAAIVALSPAALLEPVRFLAFLRIHLTLLFAAGEPRLLNSAPIAYGLGDVLGHAVGIASLATAALGVLRATVRRERRLAPLIAFVVLSCVVVGRSHLVLNRYALPLLPALAVLGAYALDALPRAAPRAVVAAALTVLQLLPTLSYLRLIASEDTRVAAATWLQEHVAPEDKVFLPGGPLWSGYVGPDLPRPLQLPKQIDPPLAAEIERRLPPAFPRQWRWAAGIGRPRSEASEPRPLAAYADAVVVTSEHPSPRFAETMTPAPLLEALERGATLLADFDIARAPEIAVYEPGDLNFAPVSGSELLKRPGPRIRIWAVPAAASEHASR